MTSPSFQELSSFFETLSSLPFQIKKTRAFPKVDYATMVSFFENLKKCDASLGDCSYESEFNIWKAAGIRHLEVQNCNVLASIFNYEITEGFGPELLARLCDYFGRPNIARILRGDAKYYVGTELGVATSNVTKRVDLYVEGLEFKILFEVKIRHYEGAAQLNSYIEELNETDCPTENKFLIFLTLSGESSKYLKKEHCPYIKHISWNLLLQEMETLLCESNFSKTLFPESVKQYLQHAKNYF